MALLREKLYKQLVSQSRNGYWGGTIYISSHEYNHNLVCLQLSSFSAKWFHELNHFQIQHKDYSLGLFKFKHIGGSPWTPAKITHAKLLLFQWSSSPSCLVHSTNFCSSASSNFLFSRQLGSAPNRINVFTWVVGVRPAEFFTVNAGSNQGGLLLLSSPSCIWYDAYKLSYGCQRSISYVRSPSTSYST